MTNADYATALGMLGVAYGLLYFAKFITVGRNKYEPPTCQVAVKRYLALPTPFDILQMEQHRRKHHGGLEEKVIA